MQDTPPTTPAWRNRPGPTAGSGTATAQEGQVETLPSPEELLRQAELKAAEHHDAWLRAKAETENVRRRAQDDIAKAHKYAVEKFASELLPVKDSLEAALAAANRYGRQHEERRRPDPEAALRRLREIRPGRDRPCQARSSTRTITRPSARLEARWRTQPGLSVLQKGYRLNERVIRPALVIVSKAKGA